MNDLSVKCLIALSVALLLGVVAGGAQTTDPFEAVQNGYKV